MSSQASRSRSPAESPRTAGSAPVSPQYDRHSSPQARAALLAAVSLVPPGGNGGALTALVEACDQDELASLSIAQGVAGRSAERLRPLLRPEAAGRLQARALRDSVRHLSYLDILRKLGEALDAAGLTWAVLKGPVLAELSYGRTPRGYTDLDLLVPGYQLHRAVEALGDAGATLARQDWPGMVREAKGEVLVTVSGVPLIDLHWHLVSEGRSRQHYDLPSDAALERRRRVRLANVDAWALDQTDFSAHVALHAAFSGAHRLRWLLDIERTVANQPPDWDLLVKRCRSWKVGLPVSVALNRARLTLGALVPAGVVEELAGTYLQRQMVRRLSTWVPAGSMPGGRSVKNGVARSLRNSLLATGGQFAGETWQALGDIIRSRPVGHGTGPLQEGDASPEVAGLAEYFAMVQAADHFGHVAKRERR